MKPINKHVSALILKAKMKLAEKGIIVLAEPINKEKNLYRTYRPKMQNMAHYILKRITRKRTLPPTMRRDNLFVKV